MPRARGAAGRELLARRGSAVRGSCISSTCDDPARPARRARAAARPAGQRGDGGSGEEAKRAPEGDGAFPMVVADEKMPGLRGVELLEWLRLVHPRAVRVPLTAHREGGVGQDAVNRAAAHLPVFKPFDLQGMLPPLRRSPWEKHRRDEQQRSLERALRPFRKLSAEEA